MLGHSLKVRKVRIAADLLSQSERPIRVITGRLGGVGMARRLLYM